MCGHFPSLVGRRSITGTGTDMSQLVLVILFFYFILLSMCEKMSMEEGKFITVRFDDPKNENNNFVQEILRVTGDEYENRELVGWLCNDYLTEKVDVFTIKECVQLWEYVKTITSVGSGSILDQIQVGQDKLFTDTLNNVKYNTHTSLTNGSYFRERKPLLLSAYSTAVSSMTTTIPWKPDEGLSYQTIWMMWWQGWNQAPPVVQKCYQSWRKHHPYWNIVLLDQNNVKQFFSLVEHLPHLDLYNTSSSKQITAFSDIIRFGLLYHYGGVWVDSTVYCHKPLMPFLWNIPSSSGFFAFTAPGIVPYYIILHIPFLYPFNTFQ